MATKTHDICIKVGEYEKDGQKKSRNRTIGRLMKSDDGHPFILLNAEVLSTPLFALSRKKGDDSVILSCFESEAKAKTTEPEAAEDGPF